jgi:hypothetical protein
MSEKNPTYTLSVSQVETGWLCTVKELEISVHGTTLDDALQEGERAIVKYHYESALKERENARAS